MDTLKIFTTLLWENKRFIYPVILYFLSTSFVGFSILLSTIKEKSWKILLPASAITGVFAFILFLNLFSYIFRGPDGIKTILSIFILFGLFLFVKNYKNMPKISLKLNNANIIYLLIASIISMLVIFVASANIYGGDIIAYWGIGHSFLNGNYPIMSPWQSDNLAIHHQGSFIYMATANMFAQARFHVVHSMYSSLVILSGFFLLWGFIYKQTKNLFTSILPVIFLYFSMGAVFVPIGEFISKLISPDVYRDITSLPSFVLAKNRLGGSSNLGELIYINHRSAALAGTLLLIILIVSKFRNKFYKPTFIALLSLATISSDEIFLPFIAIVVLGWFVISLVRNDSKFEFKRFFVAAVIFIVGFLLVGSAIRDSMLTPVKELPRFSIVFNDIYSRLPGLKSVILTQETGLTWILPGIFTYLILVIATFFFVPNVFSLIILTGSIGIFFSYLFVEHTYYLSNEGRFLHLLYHLYGFVLCYNLVLLSSKSKKIIKKIGVYLLIITLIIPSVVFSSVDLAKRAKQPEYKNLRGQRESRPILLWIRENKPNTRVFFIDGYLRDRAYSHLTLEGIQDYGLFVTISPADYKVHTPDWGYEAMDIIVTLNPEPIADLKLEYLYIADDQLKYYPEERVYELSDYLEKVYSDNEGILYRITNSYIENAETYQQGSLMHLKNVTNGNVFIDEANDIDFMYRSATTLAVKENSNVYITWGPGLFNYIETKIDLKEPAPDIQYNYLVVGPDKDPYLDCNCEELNQVWESPAAKAYEVIK